MFSRFFASFMTLLCPSQEGSWMAGCTVHVVFFGQPQAGFLEVLAKYLHGKVDGAAVGIAHKALESVLAYFE